MGNDATFDQAVHTLSLIGDQNPSRETIKKLHDGVLSAVIKGLERGTISDLETFRRITEGLMLIEPFTITVDYSKRFSEMIRNLGFLRPHAYTNDRNCFWSRSDVATFSVRLFYTKKGSEMEKPEEVLRQATYFASPHDRSSPWKPGGIEHLIALVKLLYHRVGYYRIVAPYVGSVRVPSEDPSRAVAIVELQTLGDHYFDLELLHPNRLNESGKYILVVKEEPSGVR